MKFYSYRVVYEPTFSSDDYVIVAAKDEKVAREHILNVESWQRNIWTDPQVSLLHRQHVVEIVLLEAYEPESPYVVYFHHGPAQVAESAMQPQKFNKELARQMMHELAMQSE